MYKQHRKKQPRRTHTHWRLMIMGDYLILSHVHVQPLHFVCGVCVFYKPMHTNGMVNREGDKWTQYWFWCFGFFHNSHTKSNRPRQNTYAHNCSHKLNEHSNGLVYLLSAYSISPSLALFRSTPFVCRRVCAA